MGTSKERLDPPTAPRKTWAWRHPTPSHEAPFAPGRRALLRSRPLLPLTSSIVLRSRAKGATRTLQRCRKGASQRSTGPAGRRARRRCHRDALHCVHLINKYIKRSSHGGARRPGPRSGGWDLAPQNQTEAIRVHTTISAPWIWGTPVGCSAGYRQSPGPIARATRRSEQDVINLPRSTPQAFPLHIRICSQKLQPCRPTGLKRCARFLE